jgi:hypothetical protein
MLVAVAVDNLSRLRAGLEPDPRQEAFIEVDVAELSIEQREWLYGRGHFAIQYTGAMEGQQVVLFHRGMNYFLVKSLDKESFLAVLNDSIGTDHGAWPKRLHEAEVPV